MADKWEIEIGLDDCPDDPNHDSETWVYRDNDGDEKFEYLEAKYWMHPSGKPKLGLFNKLRRNLAFFVRREAWHPQTDLIIVPQFEDFWSRYDVGDRYGTTHGILYYTEDSKTAPKSLEDRKCSANAFLENYKDYVNGYCYYYRIRRNGEFYDSCYGFEGDTLYVIQHAKENLPDEVDLKDVTWTITDHYHPYNNEVEAVIKTLTNK